ncbi:hypothetical protein [Serratia marcescens]|uniref:hypothetical protein n=1 Tax=Serratia marcescens TaxID=615 RepID=UPI001F149AF6|nr:hypothetical protein [Serratia marcescens]
MINYYFDSNAAGGGDGSKDKPFNMMSSMNGLAWPFNILVKRGSHFIDNFTLPTMTGSTQLCVMYTYGDGHAPVFEPADNTLPVMDSVIVKNFHINGEFDTIINGFAYSSHRIWHLRIDSEGTNEANVHVDGQFNFTINSMVRYECTSIYMDAKGGASITYRNDNMLVRGVTQRGGDTAVIMWCGSTYDLSAGQTNAFKGRKCRIENCTAIGIVGDGFRLSNAEGMVGQETDPNYENSSRIVNCYSSQLGRYKLDDSGTAFDRARYHVGIWIFGCDNVAIEYCISDGGAWYHDCMGFDIDGKCSGCVVRYCISTNNNGGFMMFTCTESERLESSVNSLSDWESKLISQKLGNVNNRCEYVISYNDGVGRGRYAGRWTTFQFVKNVINAIIRNCTVIDMLSRFPSHFYLCAPTSKSMTMGLMDKYPSVVDSNIFYHKYAHMNAGDAGYANFNGDTKMVWRNNIFWCPQDSGSSMNPTKGVSVGNRNVDPGISNLTDSSPSGFNAARMIRLISNSQAIGIGTANTSPDIWGKAGNNIGWQQ